MSQNVYVGQESITSESFHKTRAQMNVPKFVQAQAQLGPVESPRIGPIMCEDASCNATDFNVCCAEEGVCSAWTCPSGFAMKPDPDSLHCKNWQCSDIDLETCCEVVGRCNTYQPKPGYVLKDHPELIPCADKECTLADRDACTDAEGTCSTLSCPPQQAGQSGPVMLQHCLVGFSRQSRFRVYSVSGMKQ